MHITETLCALTLKQVVGGACEAIGLAAGPVAVEGVVGFLSRRFADHSQALMEALEQANEKAWRALEVALAGDSLWDRVKLAFKSGEDKAFRAQLQPFLAACPMAELNGRDQFRQECLRELRAASKANLLIGGSVDAASLAREAGVFARFDDPQSLLTAEFDALERMATELRNLGYQNLADLLAIRPKGESPILVIAARYFFRRQVEDNPKLFQGLAFAKLETLSAAQEQAFAGLRQVLSEQWQLLQEMIGGLQAAVAATHEAVLDVRTEQQRQGAQARELYSAVLDMQHRLDMMSSELKPRDSLSIRSDAERILVRELVSRYRQIPEGERQKLPALLNAIGKLEVAAGDYSSAQKDFQAVAGLVTDPKAEAEARYNAYRAALEKRDWETALKELREAARLDAARFSPFPLSKYVPQRILGAGGFGVAFLCRHRYMAADVVVKTLASDDLDRDADQVFAEAQVLRQLDHPSIIRIHDCGFASPQEDSRPYLVMDYFDGVTIEEATKQGGPWNVDQLLGAATQIAEGLLAAHNKGILHRDVKPANILVSLNKSETTPAPLQIKLIDFGLALKRSGRETMLATANTLAGSSIAGTLDYAAPEQMGKLPGVTVRPYSDVYGFARTCCYALFQTPQPLLRHWRGLPVALAELLESCLEDQPTHRPQDFKTVLEKLSALSPKKTEPAKPQAPTVTLPVVSPATGNGKAVADMTPVEREQELSALALRVSSCVKCSQLARSRTQTVFGEGPLDAEICLVAEAPGADEDSSGRPFVGAAGQVLNDLLSAARIRRDETYICNILKCRPPGNRQPWASEASNCREFLERQLELVKPKYIVAMGGCAAQNLLGTTQTIGKLRGRFHDYRGIPVLCTYHPAFLLPTRSPEKRKDVLDDLKILLRRMGRLVP
jgi:uracil-DNA glycosylase family 4